MRESVKNKGWYYNITKACDNTLDENKEVKSIWRKTERLYLRNIADCKGALTQLKETMQATMVTITGNKVGRSVIHVFY